MPLNPRRQLPMAVFPAIGCRDIATILSISVGGFVFSYPPSSDLDLTSAASVLFSFFSFTAGMLLMYGTVAGLRMPQLYVEFLTSVAVSSSFAVLTLYRFPTHPSAGLPSANDVDDEAIAGCPVPSLANKIFFPLFWRKTVHRAGCF